MVNRVFINDQDIVECQVMGDQTAQSVQAMGKKIEALLTELKSQHKPGLVLDNILQMGNVPPSGRNQVIALAKTVPYERLAMLGKGGLLRIGANLMIRATGRGRRMQYFSDRKKAIAWLKRT